MLTVLLATKNRANILRGTLQAFCHVESPPGGWKLVIVDNGSSDGTRDVVASFAGLLPVHYSVQPSGGKNSALNHGLAGVEGDLVVLTDDDVFPCADWLVRLREAADTHPDHTMLGGAIVPRWAEPPHRGFGTWI